ncbi:Uncharacterised protein [Salmonella enterica subsp. enterica]|nr:Uncharacterised protein [Salmonella enterica subsp. enterica]
MFRTLWRGDSVVKITTPTLEAPSVLVAKSLANTCLLPVTNCPLCGKKLNVTFVIAPPLTGQLINLIRNSLPPPVVRFRRDAIGEVTRPDGR